jgi:fatty-acyl-CoA synthase
VRSRNRPTENVTTIPTATDTTAALLLERAQVAPDATALVFPGLRLSYAELAERVAERARQLLGLGLARGDAVGLLMPNSPELVELLMAASMLGVVTIPINVRFKSRELAHVLSNGMHAVITSDAMDDHVDLAGLVTGVLPELAGADDPSRLRLADAPELRAAVLMGRRRLTGFMTQADFERGAVAEASHTDLQRARGEDPVLVMYTSGTTALPKGCIIEHRSLAANARAVAVKFGLGAGEHFWDPMPMFHMAALLPMMACFSAGASFASMSHFDADVAIEMLAADRPAVVYSCFPPVTMALVHHPRFAELRPLGARVVMNIAPPDTQQLVVDAFAPARLVGAYGMTELCGTLAYHGMQDSDLKRLTTCGQPMPGNEVRIVDPETGRNAGVDEHGEIVVRGVNRFAGYYRDPEHTRQAIDTDGFFHSGDVGSLDADGHLIYHGRLKDMLKVGGENVAALEVEDLIATLPGVKLVQVVGIPDERLTEVPAAFIELAPGAQLSEEAVIAFCQARIARFKVPRYVRFVAEWPMSATKIQKYRLGDQLAAELARSPDDQPAGSSVASS